MAVLIHTSKPGMRLLDESRAFLQALAEGGKDGSLRISSFLDGAKLGEERRHEVEALEADAPVADMPARQLHDVP